MVEFWPAMICQQQMSMSMSMNVQQKWGGMIASGLAVNEQEG